MPIDRRVLELALENLENKKKQIDEEIAALRKALGRLGGARAVRAHAAGIAVKEKTRRRPRFSKEERKKRSRRMKAYWDKWRKERGRHK